MIEFLVSRDRSRKRRKAEMRIKRMNNYPDAENALKNGQADVVIVGRFSESLDLHWSHVICKDMETAIKIREQTNMGFVEPLGSFTRLLSAENEYEVEKQILVLN